MYFPILTQAYEYTCFKAKVLESHLPFNSDIPAGTTGSYMEQLRRVLLPLAREDGESTIFSKSFRICFV